MGPYATIVADPPWSYGYDSGRWPSSPTRKHEQAIVRTAMPYTPMTMQAIRDLAVGERFAGDGCRLFLWATNHHLPEAFGVVEAWGFAYTQTLVWHKVRGPSPFGGSVAPNHAEFLLVARRGDIEVSTRWPTSVIAAGRPRSHSRKPEVFLDIVEQVSPGPYLEMFARRARFGWDYWGDESLGTAELEFA